MRKEAPLAFDLSLEAEAIQNSPSERAKARFKENFNFFAKEYFASVPIVRYSYEVKRDNGKITLFSPNYEGPIRAHYLQAAFDGTKPLWLQRRCQIEYQTFCLLEQMLSEAKPGELFAWPSPPPFEQSKEEGANYGFGKFSFVFVLRLEKNSQKERVECFALRNYLDKEGLGQLFGQMTGEEIEPLDSEHLLTQLGGINNPKVLSVLDVTQAIKSIYDSTLPSRKIIPEDDFFKKEEEAEAVLARFFPWIEGIYYLLKFGANRLLVEREFGYLVRETVRALRGEEPSLPFLEGINPAQWAWSMTEGFQRVDLRPAMLLFSPSEIFPFLAGSCGFGFGFGSSPRLVNYQTAENSFLKESQEYVVCPVCGLKVKKGISVCPYCHIKLSTSEVE